MFTGQKYISLNGIHSMQDWTATMRHGVTGKRNTRRLKDTGKLLRKQLHIQKVSVNFRLLNHGSKPYKS